VVDYLVMAAVTIAVFVVVLLVIERVTDTPLVTRIFKGTIAARERADYSVTFTPRVKPVRASLIAPAATAASTTSASR